MASAAGQARLFADNFYGTGNRSFDFGYPRQQTGDDPYPDPALNSSSASVNNQTYSGMTYWGCWSDQNPQTLTNMTYQSDSNTIDLCTTACTSGNNTVAGIEYGTQCFCGNALGYKAAQVIDSSCSMPCPGNSSEVCGGSQRLSLFSVGAPKLQPTPGTPDTAGEFYYSGCYTEATSGRALTGRATNSPAMSLGFCASFCSGYQYFGAEYGTECYCGNDFSAGANRTAAAGECSMTCANDPAQLCGAGNRLTVYQNPDWTSSSSPSPSPFSSSSSATAATASSTNTGSPLPPTSSSTIMSCPASNNTIVSFSGRRYLIECGIDHTGGDLTSLGVTSFDQCIAACASNGQCVDVSLSGTACYLKSVLGAAISNGGVWGAKLVVASIESSSSTSTVMSSSTDSSGLESPTSPSPTLTSIRPSSGSTTSSTLATSTTITTEPQTSSSSSTTFTSSSPSTTTLSEATISTVSSFTSRSSTVLASTAIASSQASTTTSSSPLSSATATPSIKCPASDNTSYMSSGVSFLVECGIDRAGGDLKSITVKTFQQCIDACAVTSGCVAVALSGVACYMKSRVGSPVKNGVWAARMVDPSFSVSTTSSTAGLPTTPISIPASSAATNVISTSSTSLSTFSRSTTTSSSLGSSSTVSSHTSSITTTTLPILAPPLPSGFSSLGCYLEPSTTRLLPHSLGSSPTQTPQQCALSCRSQNYKFSGTEYGSECWCSNNLPSSESLARTSTECNMPCSGSSSEMCGAGNRLSVVVDDTWESRISVPLSYESWMFQACYLDNTGSRTLPHLLSLSSTGGSSNTTVQNCLQACLKRSFSFCGVEYHSECYGGDTSPSASVAIGEDPLAAGCNYPCNGNGSQACGGSGKLQVYLNIGSM